ncbi:MAG: hypothetical protein LUC50_05005 [Ruminococcus sp.]|nr:hypothetical protein [Ruminococcus sp.]
MFASGLVANLSVTALEEMVLYEPVTLEASATRICVDYTGEEEHKAILFTAETLAEVDTITLADLDTGEAVATLYDDGGFTNADDGDEYMNDGVFFNYLDFSEKEVGDYAYYAQYTLDGLTYSSKTITVHVYRLFTE